MESGKAASDIYDPGKCSGAEGNTALESKSAVVNSDPYGDGWIYVLKMNDSAGLEGLKDAASYKAAIG